MRVRGSVTVFAAACLLLITSFLFALLEAGYVQGINSTADMTAEIGLESVFAEYQPVLWSDYGLLALDGTYGNEKFSADYVTGAYLCALQENLKSQKEGENLFALEVSKVSCKEYQLATDGAGAVFLRMLATAMKEKIAGQILEEMKSQYEENQQAEEKSEAKNGIENGLSAIEEAKKQEEEKEENNSEQGEQKEEVVLEVQGNPLEEVKKLKGMTVLSLVIPDVSALSEKKVDFSKSVSKRKLAVGTAKRKQSSSLADKILAAEYCEKMLSNYCSPISGRLLNYELEYILCGKDSDQENLKTTVECLLALRETANFCSIAADNKKSATALAVATALAGASANPLIIEAVKTGVIAAWAYAESVLDVRTLLAGEKISFMKNDTEWTTDLADIMKAISDGGKAKNCENGFSYQDYVKQLLWMKNKKQLAYRTMDLIEQQLQEKFPNLRMDALITEIVCESSYQAGNRFSPLVFIGKKQENGYFLQQTKFITYLP